MVRYKNLSGDSGVIAYELLNDGIKVQFIEGTTYLYTSKSAGEQNIETMKRLALSGRGLRAFISRTVRYRYAAKF